MAVGARRALLLGAIGGFLLVSALAGGWDLLYRLAYAVVAIVVASAVWSWVGLRTLRLERQPRSARSQVGAVFEERLVVRNDAPVPKLWLEVRDEAPFSREPFHQVVGLGPLTSRVWVVRTRCTRRGVFPLGPATLRTGDPLGLFRLTRRVPSSGHLVVYPAVVDLPSTGQLPGDLLAGVSRGTWAPFATASASSVREWQPGDPLNRIHWRTSARAARLMVREHEQDPMADLWIALDLEADKQVGEGEHGTEEWAVTAAASLARHYLMERRSVGLLAQGDVVAPDRGPRQIDRLLRRLAVARPAPSPSLRDLLISSVARLQRGATLVVVTPSIDRSWIDPVRLLRARGVHVAAVILDPSSFGPAPSALPFVEELLAVPVPTYPVRHGVSLAEALAYPSHGLAEARYNGGGAASPANRSSSQPDGGRRA